MPEPEAYDPWDEIPADLIDRLNDRQKAFARALLTDRRWSATAAARVAGYPWPAKQGPRLLTFPAVAAVVGVGFKLHLTRTSPAGVSR